MERQANNFSTFQQNIMISERMHPILTRQIRESETVPWNKEQGARNKEQGAWNSSSTPFHSTPLRSCAKCRCHGRMRCHKMAKTTTTTTAMTMIAEEGDVPKILEGEYTLCLASDPLLKYCFFKGNKMNESSWTPRCHVK